jgi:hypothetical protein
MPEGKGWKIMGKQSGQAVVHGCPLCWVGGLPSFLKASISLLADIARPIGTVGRQRRRVVVDRREVGIRAGCATACVQLEVALLEVRNILDHRLDVDFGFDADFGQVPLYLAQERSIVSGRDRPRSSGDAEAETCAVASFGK